MTLREALRGYVDDPHPLLHCEDLALDGSQFAGIIVVTDGTTTRAVSFVRDAVHLQAPPAQFLNFMEPAVWSILEAFKDKQPV